MTKLLLAAALLITACGKSDAPAGGSGGGGADPAARCAEAAQKAVAALPGGQGAGEVQTKLVGIITARCTQDKWPAATIDCYATQVKDMSGMKKCRETLPADQQQALMTEIRTVMMSAAGGGGAMPPHAGGGGGGGMAPPQ